MTTTMRCQRCGWCCKHININISYGDLLRWAREQRLDILCAVSYIDDADPAKRGFYLTETVTAPKKRCPFYREQRCAIYETRPRACADFPQAYTEEARAEIECPALGDFEIPEREAHELRKRQRLDFTVAEHRKDRLLAILAKARQIEALRREIQAFGNDPTEQLWVDGFDSTDVAWTEVGNSPYLNAQDEPNHYVWTATKKAAEGNWSFGNTARPATDTLEGVDLYVYGQSDSGADRDTFLLWDGTGWTDAAIGAFPNGSYGWVSADVSAILDTWAKVDGAELRIEHDNSSDQTDVDAAYLLVDYTVVVLGVAALSGTGALSAIGQVVSAAVTGKAVLSGTGALEAIGAVTVYGVAALPGAGDLSAVGQVTVQGAAALSGTGGLSAAGQTVVPGAAALSGTGGLSAAGQVEVPGVAALSGAGDLSAVGQVTVHGAAALSGAGDLSAIGQVGGIVEGKAVLSGTGGLSAVGQVIVSGAAALSGAGDLSAVGQVTVYGAAALSGTGSLSAVGQVGGIVEGKAVLSGTGALSAVGAVEVAGAAALAGAGDLAAVGRAVVYGVAALAGNGALGAAGGVAVFGIATLTGSGQLTVQAMVIVYAVAALSGVGHLSAAGGAPGVGARVRLEEGVFQAAFQGAFQ